MPVENKAVRPAERLHLHGKYVEGEVKEVVNGFMLLDSEDAYMKAKDVFVKCYEIPFVIAATYLRPGQIFLHVMPKG